MQFWSIKYLYTQGIETFEGEVYKSSFSPENGNRYATASCKPNGTRFECIGTEVFETEAEAVAAAKDACARKIASLKKKLAKVVNLAAKYTGAA